MAKHDRTVLAALVATRNLSAEDAFAIEQYCEHVDTMEILPLSMESAIDSALEYFCPPADEAEALENTPVADHNHESCPGCGGPMDDEEMTDLDYQMALDLWIQTRDMVRLRDQLEGDPSRDEC